MFLAHSALAVVLTVKACIYLAIGSEIGKLVHPTLFVVASLEATKWLVFFDRDLPIAVYGYGVVGFGDRLHRLVQVTILILIGMGLARK